MRYEKLFKKLPPRYKQEIRQEALYARKENPEEPTIKAAITIAVSILAATPFLPFTPIITGLIVLISLATLPLGIPYLAYSIRANGRKKRMERVLPDGLKLISANMEAGHTIEKAFMLSARDELGGLSDELRQTAMEMYGGKPVGEGLNGMKKRVKSELLKETLKLLADANEAGGDMAKLLDTSSKDVRQSIEMKEEIKSSIRMYAVFIIMVATIFGPVLFAVSLHTAEVTDQMWEDTGQDMDIGGGGELGIDLEFEAPQINIQEFQNFSIAALIIINFFASLIISEIQSGTATQGFKYIPVLVPASLLIFLGVSAGVEAFMGISA